MKRQRCTPALGAGSRLRTIGSTRIRWLAFWASLDTRIPLCYLAKSLENMSLCHASYFCKGWENARGCRIEHDAAVAYGLEVLYED